MLYFIALTSLSLLEKQISSVVLFNKWITIHKNCKLQALFDKSLFFFYFKSPPSSVISNFCEPTTNKLGSNDFWLPLIVSSHFSKRRNSNNDSAGGVSFTSSCCFWLVQENQYRYYLILKIRKNITMTFAHYTH